MGACDWIYQDLVARCLLCSTFHVYVQGSLQLLASITDKEQEEREYLSTEEPSCLLSFFLDNHHSLQYYYCS